MPSIAERIRKKIQGFVNDKTPIGKLNRALNKDESPSSVSANISERKQLRELDRLESGGEPRLTPAKKRKKINGGGKVPVGNYFMRGGKLYKPKAQ